MESSLSLLAVTHNRSHGRASTALRDQVGSWLDVSSNTGGPDVSELPGHSMQRPDWNDFKATARDAFTNLGGRQSAARVQQYVAYAEVGRWPTLEGVTAVARL